jgi:hypothetical protein
MLLSSFTLQAGRTTFVGFSLSIFLEDEGKLVLLNKCSWRFVLYEPMTGIEVSRILRRVWRDICINCVSVQEREEGRGAETQVGGQLHKFCVRYCHYNETHSNTTLDILVRFSSSPRHPRHCPHTFTVYL